MDSLYLGAGVMSNVFHVPAGSVTSSGLGSEEAPSGADRPMEADLAGDAKKITIIGAGIAGLVAAYELERLGHHVEIVEGSARIGGRIYTHRFTPGDTAPFAELGAMRIPTKHRLAMSYIAKLGLTDKVRDFRTIFSEEGAYHTTSAGFVRVGDAARLLVEEFSLDVAGKYYNDHTILFVTVSTVRGARQRWGRNRHMARIRQA
ncbi:MAG: flavin monoamine oxidase family protein [Egibacteraceae bacterium]